VTAASTTTRPGISINAAVAIVGLGLGFSLSRIGFSSWDEVHAMFTFADLRLTLAFGTAVALLVPVWIVLRRTTGAKFTQRLIHRGTLAGGVIFGAGWALCGACPAIALVQLGEGQLGAFATLAGILLGNYAYAVVHERYFRWTQATCVDA
jgi:uncharacterized membrane protein YedE/YeeE